MSAPTEVDRLEPNSTASPASGSISGRTAPRPEPCGSAAKAGSPAPSASQRRTPPIPSAAATEVTPMAPDLECVGRVRDRNSAPAPVVELHGLHSPMPEPRPNRRPNFERPGHRHAPRPRPVRGPPRRTASARSPTSAGWPAASARRGSALIAAAAMAAGVIGAGALYVVSLAAQYRYVFAVRHQNAASMIEALCWTC